MGNAAPQKPAPCLQGFPLVVSIALIKDIAAIAYDHEGIVIAVMS